MSNQIIVFIFSICLIEIIQYSKIILLIINNLKYFNKIFKIIISTKISDHWKEKVLLKYSIEILYSSMKILFIIILIIIFFIILNFFHNDFKTFAFSLSGALEITFIACIYYYLRKKFID